jgi:hypothetical protein
MKPSEYMEALAKAKGMPIGALRRYGNGEWFRKVGGPKGWEYIGKQGGARVEAALKEARAKGHPIVTPSVKVGGAKPQGEKPQSAPKPRSAKPPAPAEKKGPKVNLGARVQLERMAKDHPGTLRKKIIAAINVADPNMSPRDIQRRMYNPTREALVRYARTYNVEADPALVKPEGWDTMPYKQRIQANRELFIEQLVRKKHARGDVQEIASQYDRYRGLDDEQLLSAAETWMGRDPNHRGGYGTMLRAGQVSSLIERVMKKYTGDNPTEFRELLNDPINLIEAAEKYLGVDDEVPLDNPAPKPDGWERMTLEEQFSSNRRLVTEEAIRRTHERDFPNEPLIDLTKGRGRAELLYRLSALRGASEEYIVKSSFPVSKPEPEGWQYMTYEEKIAADPQYLLDEIARRNALKDTTFYNREKLVPLLDDYLTLKKIAENVLGPDQGPTNKQMRDLAGELPKTPRESLLKSSPAKMTGSPKAGGINTTRIVELKHSDGTKSKAIFKSTKGEHKGDLRGDNIKSGQQWKRERLAYVVDQIVGLDLVPPVVVRAVDGDLGVCMDFVEGEVWCATDFRLKNEILESPEGIREFQKLAMFDFIIGNTDRHSGNWMVDEQHKLRAIDHGLSFPEQNNLGVDGFRSDPTRHMEEREHLKLPQELLNLLTPEKKEAIKKEIVHYGIGGYGVELFEQRWNFLVKTKRLPSRDLKEMSLGQYGG